MSSGLIRCQSVPGIFSVKICMSVLSRLGITWPTLTSLPKIRSYSVAKSRLKLGEPAVTTKNGGFRRSSELEAEFSIRPGK